MLKSKAISSLLPVLAVTIVLVGASLAPSRTPFGSSLVGCVGYGYGYGYGYGGTSAPTVTGLNPNAGSIAGGTVVDVTGAGFCNTVTSVHFGSTAATNFTVQSDTLLQATSPAHAAGTVDVTVTNPGGTSATSTADHFTFVVVTPITSCSTSQFGLTGNNGSTWVDLGGSTSVTFTPSVNSFAILNANADLWTSTAGFNQDLGIAVTGGAFPTTAGQPEAWKESGGFGGTFSPNAANAQAVISVAGGTSYTAKIQWKANQSDAGTIFAGAGPIGGKFSPTCLSFRLIPISAATVVTASTTAQYSLTGSNGTTWQDVNAALSVTYTPTANGFLVLAGNADLWTANAGFNQDLAINLDGTVAAWKESGGFAGTFSPNAAFVLDVAPVTSGTAHTAKLQWKANKADSGTIFAGAGPIGGKFSPTSLSLIFLPSGIGSAPFDKASTTQYTLNSSDGTTWQSVDPFALTLNYTPTNDCQAILSGNADLWTGTAGFNQDLGVSVVDTGFPTTAGQPEGFKESGGFNGTFSPNAAYVQVVVTLQGGHTYTAQLVWKTNKNAAGASIFAGAGPISGAFSPTRLTLQPVGC